MLTWLVERVFFAESPLVWFLLLVVATHLIYHYCFDQDSPSMGAMSWVLALGVFGAYILPHFDTPLWVMTLSALELMIIWLYFAVNMMQLYAQDEHLLPLHTDRWRLGCWVAATAVTGLLLEEADPLLYGCIIMLAFVSTTLWVMHLKLLIPAMKRLKLGQPATGLKLLPAIGTLMLMILAIELFHDDMPAWMDVVMLLVAGGISLYGLIAIIVYWFRCQSNRLMLTWPNINALIYGTLACYGLLAIETGLFSSVWLLSWWCITASVWFVLTSIELTRACSRVEAIGWRRGLWVYSPTQWYRFFACVMMVGFTHEIWVQTATLNVVIQGVNQYGKILLSMYFVVQLILLLKAKLRWLS